MNHTTGIDFICKSGKLCLHLSENNLIGLSFSKLTYFCFGNSSVRCCFLCSPSLQMAGRGRLVPCVCLGLFAVLCWVWVSFASFPDEQLPLEGWDAVDRGAFQPHSVLSEMEFASISSYTGPGNSDRRSNKELPILLWWSAGLFPHFPGDTNRIDCATSSCLATSNRKVS